MLSGLARYCEEGMGFGGRYFAPVDFMYGVQRSYPRLFRTGSAFRLERLEDYDNVLARLRALPAALDGVRRTLEAGVRAGMVYAEGTLTRVDAQFDKLQVRDWCRQT